MKGVLDLCQRAFPGTYTKYSEKYSDQKIIDAWLKSFKIKKIMLKEQTRFNGRVTANDVNTWVSIRRRRLKTNYDKLIDDEPQEDEPAKDEKKINYDIDFDRRVGLNFGLKNIFGQTLIENKEINALDPSDKCRTKIVSNRHVRFKAK